MRAAKVAMIAVVAMGIGAVGVTAAVKAGEPKADKPRFLAPEQQKRIELLKSKGPEASLTILPVRASWLPYNSMIERVTEATGGVLEWEGLKNIAVGKTVFKPEDETDMERLAVSLGEFVKKNPITTDYALYVQHNGPRRGPLVEFRVVVVDKTGALVWSDRQTPQDEAFKRLEAGKPRGMNMLLIERLSPLFGLNEETRKAAKPKTAGAYILKGQELFAAKKVDEALEAFQKAAELEPDNLYAKMGQYATLAALNRPDDGLAVLDKWIEAKPDDPQRWECKFFAAAEIRRPEVALETCDKLIQLQPADGSHWVGRGQMLAALHRNDEALKAFDKAVTLAPKHEAAWANRGEILVGFGKYDEAIKSCGKAIELRSTWADPWYSRAKAYALSGDTTNALSDLKKAIELQPGRKSKASKDPDFRRFHDNAEFKNLTQ